MSSLSCAYANCIPASDVRPALFATLLFIKDHPLLLAGKPAQVHLELSSFLRENQVNDLPMPILAATNTVSGIILEVTPDYVILANQIPCTDTDSFYLVLLSSIVTLTSRTLEAQPKEYLAFMSQLPPICQDCDSAPFKLLSNLSTALCLQDEKITLLLDGITTRPYAISSIKIVANLLFLENFFIFPITQIGGFSFKKCL